MHHTPKGTICLHKERKTERLLSLKIIMLNVLEIVDHVVKFYYQHLNIQLHL